MEKKEAKAKLSQVRKKKKNRREVNLVILITKISPNVRERHECNDSLEEVTLLYCDYGGGTEYQSIDEFGNDHGCIWEAVGDLYLL